jgi:hypothetical protein
LFYLFKNYIKNKISKQVNTFNIIKVIINFILNKIKWFKNKNIFIKQKLKLQSLKENILYFKRYYFTVENKLKLLIIKKQLEKENFL